MKGDILKSRVNSFVGSLFLASAALVAFLIMWQTAFNYNPLARALENHYAPVIKALNTEK